MAPETTWATRAAFLTRFGDNTTAIVSWDHESLDQLAVATTGIVALPAAPGIPGLPVDESAYLDPRGIPTVTDAVGSNELRRFDGVTLIVDHAVEWGSPTPHPSWRDSASATPAVHDARPTRRTLH